MKRREFLTAAAAGAAVPATLAAPAIAQSAPEVRWRLTSSFPKSLDTLFGTAELFARYVSDATDGKFQIQVFAPGEVVPALQALDAVQNGTVEVAQTATYYYVGKDPALGFGTAIPFGLNSRQQNAWMYYGGGIGLMNEVLKNYNVYGLPAGNTGTQMGGFFRKEIKTVADLQGLKFRVSGLAGRVLQKLGVVPQQIGAGDIYPSLERGTIDAAEWVGPYDDEKLGLARVAPFYYYPGWWEGCAMLHLLFGLDKWNALPKSYQSIVTAAAQAVNADMQAKYDERNPAALKRLVAGGVQLRPFSPEILDATYKAANELYAEIAGQNAAFKKMYDALVAFRGDQYLWWQVAEYSYDSYMIRARSRG